MKHYSINNKIQFFLTIAILFFISYQSSANENIYATGTKFVVNVRCWGLSAYGIVEIIGNTKIEDQEVILVRSQTVEVGGFLGFIVRFMRIYKESNTFDSYIDLKTRLPVRYEVYKLNKDGSKKTTENVLFDRKHQRVISYEDKSTVLSNTPPNIQDTFSGLLNLVYSFNTDGIFIGKSYDLDLFIYQELAHINIEVVSQKMINGQKTYTFEISKLPDIFKYPASLKFDVVDAQQGLDLPTTGECVIDVPVLNDVTLKGDLTKVK